MARFGDIARIEADGLRLRVTLKSGSVFDLERMNADDLGDGVRVWDETRGVLNVGDWRIGSIELFPATHRSDPLPGRLHGTMLTRQGDFTGFVQWDRRASVGTDELHGQTADGPRSLRFDLIRSVERRSEDGLRLTLADGSEIELSSSGRGTYVDDQRYGRVLISPDAFERLDFSPAGSGPAYDDFPPGQPLTGSVTTRTGRRLVGRLVYDLDESETTETLDARSTCPGTTSCESTSTVRPRRFLRSPKATTPRLTQSDRTLDRLDEPGGVVTDPGLENRLDGADRCHVLGEVSVRRGVDCFS